MATTTTFTTLKEDVQRYLERGSTLGNDPVIIEQLPRLINLAERRIARELKVQGFINVVTGALTPGHSTRKQVYTRSYEYVRQYWPDEGETGEPVFTADYDYSHWVFAPTPDAAYPFEILYYELPPLLDDTVQTNWLTEYAPQLLLYGTLLEATPFLKNDERIQVWQGMYDRAAAMLNGEDLAKVLDRNSARKEA
jgi:hypothetical protein